MQFLRQFPAKGGILTTGAGQELVYPVAKLFPFASLASALHRELRFVRYCHDIVVFLHDPVSRDDEPSSGRPSRWVCSLKLRNVQRSKWGSYSHSVRPVFTGRSWVPVPGWGMPRSTRIEAMMTPAWHTATTV
jgi:hypothetical protein